MVRRSQRYSRCTMRNTPVYFATFLSLAVGYLLYTNYDYLEYVKHYSHTYTLKSSEMKALPKKIYKILYWTETFGSKGPAKHWFGLGSDAFSSCRYDNCFSVTKGEAEYNTSDAVLFHMRFLTNKTFPTYRFSQQKWIMHIIEPPSYEPDYSKYNGLFNATWTYHRKSDIWTNHSLSIFVKKTPAESGKTQNKNYAKGRDKLAAWFVSHCHPLSKRDKYVAHLQKYIHIDIYGECGPLKCGRSNMSDCLSMLKKHYKFYLAFENSICDDYSSYKLWHPLYNDVVPVVLGGYNYSDFLPKGSYIDIKDYPSPEALAKYLKRLDKDDNLYNKHFEWKKQYKLMEVLSQWQCSLCEYLNKADGTTKVYDRLDLFWNKTRDCQSPEKYYKNIDEKFWT